jgi:hypothetical protein
VDVDEIRRLSLGGSKRGSEEGHRRKERGVHGGGGDMDIRKRLRTTGSCNGGKVIA